MKKKHALTLLEVTLAIMLLGLLLSALFQLFQQGAKKNISAKQLKQQVLEYELFHQRLKFLLSSQQKVWIGTHQNAIGPVLYFSFLEKADPELLSSKEALGMVYIDERKRLNFVAWGKEGSWVETLLDNVTYFNCEIFDTKKAQWTSTWPYKKKQNPPMAKVTIEKEKNRLPFFYFLSSNIVVRKS